MGILNEIKKKANILSRNKFQITFFFVIQLIDC